MLRGGGTEERTLDSLLRTLPSLCASLFNKKITELKICIFKLSEKYLVNTTKIEMAHAKILFNI